MEFSSSLGPTRGDALEEERAARGLAHGLAHAVGLLRDGHGALAGAVACLAPTDPRRARISTAAFLISVGLQDLEDLRPSGERAGHTGGA